MPVAMMSVDEKTPGRGTQVSWSSIFSGAFTTLGFGLFFLLLGNSMGLSINNIANPVVGGSLQFGSWIYVAFTMVFSYYLGGLLSAGSNENRSISSGGMHGVISWSLASLLALILAVFVSPLVRHLLDGTVPKSVNWLATCIVGFGFFAAVIGGVSGKEEIDYTQLEEEEEEIRKLG